jgi:uncharacterized protein (TIGR02145 family)
VNTFYPIRILILTACCLLTPRHLNARAYSHASGNHDNRSSSDQSIQVKAGWNLLSLPVVDTLGIKSVLFPTAASAAYIFEQGYIVKDTLRNGMGFWLKFDSSQTVSVTGDSIFEDMIDVSAAWNIIGSLTMPIAVNTIQSSPPGIVGSQYFSFVPGFGYQIVDTLQPGNGYWVKANDDGRIILSTSSISCPGTPTVDIQGKTYHTVQIGTQCWLKENLDAGTMVAGNSEQTNNGILEKYCYNNDTANCDAYGGLYQWNESMQYDTVPGAQGICPGGWHIPRLAEYQALSATVSGEGNALKAIGQGNGAGAGTNTSGFSALLTGYRNGSGAFYYLESYANVWSSTKYNATFLDYLNLDYGSSAIYLYDNSGNYGYSVRCIMDTANRPPDVPSHPAPADSATGVSTGPTLTWMCSDPDDNPLTYDLYFGTDNPPAMKVSAGQNGTSLSRSGLLNSTAYYWKVVARDNHGETTAGPVWRFTTIANKPPAQPSNPNPANNTLGQSTNITLTWSCSDPENDSLTYDIYFGKDNPPATKVSSDQNGKTLSRSDLANGTTYYWKVVAKDNYSNSTGGPVWKFMTLLTPLGPCPGMPIVDYAGKTYNTIQIGAQCWLKENLDLGTRVDGRLTQTNNSIIEKYCYNNDTANCNTYGGLYQWNEVMQYDTTPGARGICPGGWHIPTRAELQTLSNTTGGDGNALKAIGQGGGAGAGTDASGFSALLAGYAGFNAIGDYAYIWSSSVYSGAYVYALSLNRINNLIGLNIYGNLAFSARCLKD